MRMRSFDPAARVWLRAVKATAPVARAEVLTKVRRETVLVCIRKCCESEPLTRRKRGLFSEPEFQHHEMAMPRGWGRVLGLSSRGLPEVAFLQGVQSSVPAVTLPA